MLNVNSLRATLVQDLRSLNGGFAFVHKEKDDW